MSERSTTAALKDIREAIERIQRYIGTDKTTLERGDKVLVPVFNVRLAEGIENRS